MTTAIKWYIDAVNTIRASKDKGELNDEDFLQNMVNAELQANGLFKRQIIDAVYESLRDEGRYCGDYNHAYDDAIKYYNRTFNK